MKPGLRERLMTELPLKIRVWLGLAVGICVPYFLLQRFPLLPVQQMPQTRLDGQITFAPDWVLAYGSIALLVPLLPALAHQRDALERYARGLAVLCGLCFTVFLLLPVEGPRPPVVPDQWLYRLLVSVDTKLNSMPSLHAGLVTYSLLFGRRILRGERGGVPGPVLLVGLLWGTAILYATLATKQHWAVDLPPGMLAAWIADQWAWRPARAQGASVGAD